MAPMEQKAQDILDFWFGDGTEYREEWFKKDPAFDERIRERFGEDLERAIRGEYDGWAKTANGRLALIILLDQFSRNLFRDSPKAWAQDKKALDLALEAIGNGQDLQVDTLRRMFFYLPLQHSEDLGIQELSLQKHAEMLKEGGGDPNSREAMTLGYAERHHVIIERFGRFPHRNKILGRESTPEEIEFLKQPNSSF